MRSMFKKFLVSAFALVMVAAFAFGIVNLNRSAKTVSAEGTYTVYAVLDANAEKYKEYVKINCNDGGEWWDLVDMTYDDVAQMYKATIDSKATRVQLSFKSNWWTNFVESDVANNSIFTVSGNSLSYTGTYVEPTPVTYTTINFYTDWANPSVYAWLSTDDSKKNADWPGEAMEAIEGKAGWFAYEVADTFDTIIFSNSGADQLNNGQAIGDNGNLWFYNGVWYADYATANAKVVSDKTYFLVGVFGDSTSFDITNKSVELVARTGDNGAAYNVTLAASDVIQIKKGDGTVGTWQANDDLIDVFENQAIVKAAGEYNVYVNTADNVYIEAVSDDLILNNVDIAFASDDNVLIPGTQYTLKVVAADRDHRLAAKSYTYDAVYYNKCLYLDGYNALTFTAPADGAYDIVVEHFNHLVRLKAGEVAGDSTNELTHDDYLKKFRVKVKAGVTYTLESPEGGFGVYGIYFVDQATVDAQERAALVAEKRTAMYASEDHFFLFGLDDEWDFSENALTETPNGTDYAKGTFTFAKGDKIKVRYIESASDFNDDISWQNWDQSDPDNACVAFDGEGNAVIPVAGSYSIFVNNGSQAYIRPAAFEDLGLTAIKYNASINDADGTGYVLLVAAFDLDAVDANGTYQIGFIVNGVENVNNVYYSAIATTSGNKTAADIFFGGAEHESYKLIVAEFAVEADAADYDVQVVIYNGEKVVSQITRTISKPDTTPAQQI